MPRSFNYLEERNAGFICQEPRQAVIVSRYKRFSSDLLSRNCCDFRCIWSSAEDRNLGVAEIGHVRIITRVNEPSVLIGRREPQSSILKVLYLLLTDIVLRCA